MSITELGTVRMVHVFGGPCRMVRCIQNGDCIFIEWPLNGLIRIVLTSGALWDSRKCHWTMHPDDLKRITVGEPIHINPSITNCEIPSPLHPDPRILTPAKFFSHHSPMRATESRKGEPRLRKPR